MGTLARTDMASLTLKERLQLKKKSAALLLDLSSSMDIDIEPGRTRLTALREIVDGLEGAPVIIGFNDSAYEIPSKKDVPANGRGSTYMSRAIALCKQRGIMNAVMITDGEATDKSATLDAVVGFTLQVMYVGSGTRPKFLDELAAKCGGYATTQNLKFTKELTEKVQLLLGRPDAPKGDIQL